MLPLGKGNYHLKSRESAFLVSDFQNQEQSEIDGIYHLKYQLLLLHVLPSQPNTELPSEELVLPLSPFLPPRVF